MKINVYPCKPHLLYKRGFRGSKLYRHVFVMFASAQSDQSLCCPHKETASFAIHNAPSEASDQAGNTNTDLNSLDPCRKVQLWH